jgi:hypothetical protein
LLQFVKTPHELFVVRRVGEFDTTKKMQRVIRRRIRETRAVYAIEVDELRDQ